MFWYYSLHYTPVAINAASAMLYVTKSDICDNDK